MLRLMLPFFCILFLSCSKTSPYDSELNVVGGMEGIVVENAVMFVKPGFEKKPVNEQIACGSGVIVHPRVVLATAHCLNERKPPLAPMEFTELRINGHAPIEYVTAQDVIEAGKKDGTPGEFHYFDDMLDYDLMILIYDTDLIKARNIVNLVPISEFIPGAKEALALVGYGRSKRGDTKKLTQGVQRFGVNIIDWAAEGYWGWSSDDNNPSIFDVGIVGGDSGAAVLDSSGYLIGIGSSRVKDADHPSIIYNSAIDLTAGPAKKLFYFASKHCETLGKKVCMPWFPGAWSHSEYSAGLKITPQREAMISDAVALYDRLAFRARLLAKNRRPTVPAVHTTVFQSPAANANIRSGDFVEKIDGQIAGYYTENIALYNDITGNEDRELSVVVNSEQKSFTPRKLSGMELENRYHLSMKRNYPVHIPGNNNLGVQAHSMVPDSGSPFRWLKIESVDKDGLGDIAGLIPGDVVTEVNYRSFASEGDIARALEHFDVDGTRIRIIRDNQEKILRAGAQRKPLIKIDEEADYMLLKPKEINREGNPLLSKERYSNPQLMDFVKIEAGTSNLFTWHFDEQANRIETPIEVKKTFMLMTKEVTRQQWRVVTDCYPEDMHAQHPRCARPGEQKRKCYGPRQDLAPVTCVSWDDIEVLFLRVMNSSPLDFKYAVPSLSELLYVALNKGNEFHIDPAVDYLTTEIHQRDRLGITGSLKANSYGVFDLLGNASEFSSTELFITTEYPIHAYLNMSFQHTELNLRNMLKTMHVEDDKYDETRGFRLAIYLP